MPRGSIRLPLTRERVLRAAVAVIDREGLGALSMRRLGIELGVEAMSLYRYVPSKADLLDGVYEVIVAEIAVPKTPAAWSNAVRQYARAFRKVLVAHPNALSLFATRPAVSTASLRHVEMGLRLLRGAGFGVDDAISAFQVIVTFVVGHTLSTHAPVTADEQSVPAYRDLSAIEFPALVEVAGAMDRHDVDREFDVGIDALLEGFGCRLARVLERNER